MLCDVEEVANKQPLLQKLQSLLLTSSFHPSLPSLQGTYEPFYPRYTAHGRALQSNVLVVVLVRLQLARVLRIKLLKKVKDLKYQKLCFML